jgi:hypothetical protein
MPTDRPSGAPRAADERVSLSEASAMCGRDRKTLLRDIGNGRFPHHSQDTGGRRGHTLLVQDLLDVGLLRQDQVAPPRGGRNTWAASPEYLRLLELEAEVGAQRAVIEELRAEAARMHELAMALIARLGSSVQAEVGD